MSANAERVPLAHASGSLARRRPLPKTDKYSSRGARRTPNLPFPTVTFSAGSANFPKGSGSSLLAIMPKFLGKQRLWAAVGVAVPLAIFFAARSAASWRPHMIGVQPNIDDSAITEKFLILSPDGKWLASRGYHDEDGVIWNLNTSSKRQLCGNRIAFSNDSRFIITDTDPSTDENSSRLLEVQSAKGSSLWKRKLPFSQTLVGSSGDKEIETKTDHSRRFYGLITGKIIRVLPSESSSWKSIECECDTISYFPIGSSKPAYSFGTTNKYDTWSLSPNKQQLWVSLGELNRFDILDAQTGKRLWFYTSNDADEGQFACYPHFEDGGKKLATIENDALVVRDSGTGKVLLSHKNNLPAPLKSWAFTKDGSAVYLMDAKGEIFRQRLR